MCEAKVVTAQIQPGKVDEAFSVYRNAVVLVAK